jgi:hypothetical protein
MMTEKIYTDEQKAQFDELLTTYPDEVAGLRVALADGKIEGSWYWSKYHECGCVLGTVAKLRGEPHQYMQGYDAGELSPLERLACEIGIEDTPETNPVSALLVQWIDEHIATVKGAE